VALIPSLAVFLSIKDPNPTQEFATWFIMVVILLSVLGLITTAHTYRGWRVSRRRKHGSIREATIFGEIYEGLKSTTFSLNLPLKDSNQIVGPLHLTISRGLWSATCKRTDRYSLGPRVEWPEDFGLTPPVALMAGRYDVIWKDQNREIVKYKAILTRNGLFRNTMGRHLRRALGIYKALGIPRDRNN